MSFVPKALRNQNQMLEVRVNMGYWMLFMYTYMFTYMYMYMNLWYIYIYTYTYIFLEVWNICSFDPYLGRFDPIWISFKRGWNPPTSLGCFSTSEQQWPPGWWNAHAGGIAVNLQKCHWLPGGGHTQYTRIISIHIRILICVYILLYIHIYIRVYTYIHTHQEPNTSHQTAKSNIIEFWRP